MRRRVTFLLITLFFILSGCRVSGGVDKNADEASREIKKGELVNIMLYYPDKNSEYLMPDTRLVAFEESYGKTVIKELLNGPGRPELTNPIPTGTKLLSIDRNKGSVIVNLSKEFKDNHPGGSSGEIMSIFSIVNTLTEIPGIKTVEFRINGKKYETLAGHMTFNEPFKRNRELFKRNSSLKPDEALRAQMNFEKQGDWVQAYALMSDDENNPDRKYYNEYVKDMEEVAEVGFTEQDFQVGEYTLSQDGKKARVKVNFISKQPDGSTLKSEDMFFNCVKVEKWWMVDWLTQQQ